MWANPHLYPRHYGTKSRYEGSFWNWKLQLQPTTSSVLKSSVHEKGIAGHSPDAPELKIYSKSKSLIASLQGFRLPVSDHVK